MAYVITQNCCKDASCVAACPVDCIRPTGDERGTQMLFIDPETCIDCGACADECPVDAIYSEFDLPPEMERFREINAAYFRHHPLEPGMIEPLTKRASIEPGALRVAVVGAGPAACYAAAELLESGGVEVDLFERLPTPFGLIRAGVAPDHQRTKSVVRIFDAAFADSRFGCHLNVEIGKTLTHADLLAHHHAVIYAVGASASRDLGITGEHLPGHHAAAEFVGWYNGHPDHAGRRFDLSARRAVVVGNGNVALDVARVLLMSPEELAATDIAEYALEALAHSHIEEVIVLGRRGPRDAAFSVGEFHALGHLTGIDVIIEGGDLAAHPDDDVETALKLEIAREFAARPATEGHKRIVFRFLTAPAELVGGEHVEQLRTVRNRIAEDGTFLAGSLDGETDSIETSLVLRSIGYQGDPVGGLPYDARTGTVPNQQGRVVDDTGAALPGVYVAGWIKRGPRGVIGTNRACAAETVAALLADFHSGALDRQVGDREALRARMIERGADAVGWTGWRAIDAAERERGAAATRPRVKFFSVDEMLAVARR
ncbi:FAD-dependent oxidoreductase [Nocardia abscessus]|uniref:FAD-dependent oxidoreductase n=1 Tax=Nocardia abscessus TaxID=120957 RepID=UPI002455D7CA|nr:FAD-dependent oxidoreductase [Nocardia abscessus]